MEKSPATATSHLEPVLQEPCGIIIFLAFLTWSISKIQRLLPGSCQSCSSPADKAPPTPVVADKRIIKTRNKNEDDEMELTHEDINAVMRNIGLGFDQENSLACNSIGSECISRLFDDDEPSLHEVRQAFLVFDDNKDGYIDASDLQRVLRSLGLGEGVGVYECEQMIAKYDMNKDMRIDLAEFTKVLEVDIC
ncbi:probable calcium-binding protein CML46 [Phragmites australis]|uniref:probable calcium-binding protein CML46 n=1 Tax=Phragmites australis TaxID=29695 RepID=UPI002D7A098B|nr:probable calcium-binding protein CML46 [Phragmites australis]